MGGLYGILFRWWLDVPLAKKAEARFAREIRENLSFLFEDKSAAVVPNEGVSFPPPLDYALVTVAVGRLLFRFVRGGGEFRIEMALSGDVMNSRDWKDLRVIWAVLNESEADEPFLRLRNLLDADSFLRAELVRLQELASKDQWGLVKRKANALFPLPMRIR